MGVSDEHGPIVVSVHRLAPGCSENKGHPQEWALPRKGRLGAARVQNYGWVH